MVISIGLNAQTFTFQSAGSDNLWNNSANWDQGSVPGVTDVIVIDAGETAVYDLGGDFNYTGTGLTINGSLNMSGEKLKLKSNGVITIASTGSLSNVEEFKLEDFATGSIASGASVSVEKFKTKNFASIAVNASCIAVTGEIKIENVSSVTGTGCIDYSGDKYENTSSVGIFGCTSGTASDCVNIVGGGGGEITFDGGPSGTSNSWNTAENWDGDVVPDPDNEDVTIPDGFTVNYDAGGNLEFKN